MCFFVNFNQEIILQFMKNIQISRTLQLIFAEIWQWKITLQIN